MAQRSRLVPSELTGGQSNRTCSYSFSAEGAPLRRDCVRTRCEGHCRTGSSEPARDREGLWRFPRVRPSARATHAGLLEEPRSVVLRSGPTSNRGSIAPLVSEIPRNVHLQRGRSTTGRFVIGRVRLDRLGHGSDPDRLAPVEVFRSEPVHDRLRHVPIQRPSPVVVI